MKIKSCIKGARHLRAGNTIVLLVLFLLWHLLRACRASWTVSPSRGSTGVMSVLPLQVPPPRHSDHQSQRLHAQSGSVHLPQSSPDSAPDSRGARVMVSMPAAPRDSTEHPGPPGHPFQSRQLFPPPEVLVISRSELKLLQPSAKGSAWGAGGLGGCTSSSEVSWSGGGREGFPPVGVLCPFPFSGFPYTGCPDKPIKATCKNMHSSNRYLSPSIYQALRKEWGQNENENFLHLRNIFVKGHLGGSVG